jgi:3-isopropylmalate/(R)-2-methylmalate dehydratase small subunit
VAPTLLSRKVLFTRNCINAGLPVLSLLGISQHITTGDELEIDLDAGALRNLRSSYKTQLPRMAPESLELIREWGIVAYTQRILAERRAVAANKK